MSTGAVKSLARRKLNCHMLASMRRCAAAIGVLIITAPCSEAAMAAGGGVPSTFGATIGPALLCLDHLDPFFFWSYLNEFSGPPYKREGGAYWFKIQATLWGAPVSEVLVSDGSSSVVFLAAAVTAKPDTLSGAIRDKAGINHVKEAQVPYSPLSSGLGSKIVYSGENSKIYCAKYNLDRGR